MPLLTLLSLQLCLLRRRLSLRLRLLGRKLLSLQHLYLLLHLSGLRRLSADSTLLWRPGRPHDTSSGRVATGLRCMPSRDGVGGSDSREQLLLGGSNVGHWLSVGSEAHLHTGSWRAVRQGQLALLSWLLSLHRAVCRAITGSCTGGRTQVSLRLLCLSLSLGLCLCLRLGLLHLMSLCGHLLLPLRILPLQFLLLGQHPMLPRAVFLILGFRHFVRRKHRAIDVRRMGLVHLDDPGLLSSFCELQYGSTGG